VQIDEVSQLIQDKIRDGATDDQILAAVLAHIQATRQQIEQRAARNKEIAGFVWHVFIDPHGQRVRVRATDMEAFCTENRLDIKRMTELSNGGIGGLSEYRGWRRDRGTGQWINGSAYRDKPELPDEDHDSRIKPIGLMFPKPKPRPTPKPMTTYQPRKETNHDN
jgi:hypothetical protein